MEKDNKKFISDITVLKKASETKKLVIFVGAGVSMNSKIPSWNTLITKLKEDIGITKEDTEDPLQIAQVYYNQRKHKEYVEKIREVLLYNRVVYNDIHEVLFDLKPEHIVTTNYDDCLEQVIKKRALPFSVIKQDSDFPYASNSNLLVKIHGDLSNDDFVLKEDDYLNYEHDHPLFEAFIKAVFSTKTVLFLGYSYSDINLKIILQKVKNILGNNYQNSYLMTHEQLSGYKKDYLKNKGVEVISYTENEYCINSFLNGDNVKKKNYRLDVYGMNKHGQKLLNLICFLLNYDRFREDLRNKVLIDQMYLALERFSELTSLPYYFISNLYPFSNSEGRVYNNEQAPFTLAVSNENLLQFLHDNTFYENGKTQFNQDFLAKLKVEEVESYVSKLNYIVDVLNYSSISYLDVSRKSDKNFHKEHNIIMHSKSTNICESLSCLFYDLKFDKLLDVISSKGITETSSLEDDLMLAYAHYKLGNIYHACGLFENIGQKAWHANKYITYFIAKFNYKKLSRLLEFSEYGNINKIEIDKLIDIAENIDLEDVYSQINDVSKEESSLIKDIRDDRVLQYCNNQIGENYRDVLRTYNELGRGVKYYSAPKYSEPIIFHLFVIDQFYGKNSIVKDEFTEYKAVMEAALKALLVYYSFGENYPVRIVALDIIFCRTFVHYADANSYEHFFKEYNIQAININEKAKKDLLEISLSYFSSYFGKVGFDGKVEANEKVCNQSSKGVLRSGLVKYFDNIMLLLSKTNLSKQAIEDICVSVIKYISAVDFLYWKNMEYLSMFINGNKENIPISFYDKLFSVMLDKPMIMVMEVLEEVGYVLMNNVNEMRLSNAELINKFKKHDEGNEIRYKNKLLLCLWQIYNDDFRPIFKKEIEENLEKYFEIKTYVLACYWRIIDYNMFFENYLLEVNKTKAKRQEENDSDELSNLVFINFISLCYFLNIKFDDDRFKSLTDLEEYMIFYLNPEVYDYSKFKPIWLEYSLQESIHVRLKDVSEVCKHLKEYLKDHPNDKILSNLYIKYYI